MFGFATFSQSPFSATGNAIYDVPVLIEGQSDFDASAQAIRIGSADITSESGLSVYAIRYGVGGATIVGESDLDALAIYIRDTSATLPGTSTISASALRYAIAQGLVASESGLECYAIRYGVGGATIVGESDISTNPQRIAIAFARIDAESQITGSTNVIVNQSALIEAVSALMASVVYDARAVATFGGASAIIAAARKKWEDEPDVAEVWVDIPDTPDTWTPVPDTGEIWNNVR